MKMIINGHAVDASDGATLQVLNPATMELIDTVPSATYEDVEQALDIAQHGKAEWAAISLYKRLEILYRFANLFESKIEEFAPIMCKETGKPLAACKGEAAAAIHIFRCYCEKARNYGGYTLPENSEDRVEGDIVFTLREPLGLIACIVPFNYPTELYAHKVAPALVTGNAVIVKPSSDTPLGNIYMTQLLIDAGVPAAAVQIVTGSGAKIGDQLSKSKKIDAISLTGSTAVGISTAKNTAENLTPTYLELGGNDPLIIFDDADLDQAVEEALVGRGAFAGQTCCASKRFLVHNKVKAAFTEKLVARLSNVKVGDPFDPMVDYGPIINERAAKEVEEQINLTVSQGARCVIGGKRYNHTFIDPTVLTDVTPNMDIASHMEVFGPVYPIIGFDTAEEAIAIANSAPYGLSSGVMTKDISRALKVARAMQAGTCVVNGSGNYRSAHLEFGGHKMTGLGREGAMHTLDEFTQTKTIALKQLLK